MAKKFHPLITVNQEVYPVTSPDGSSVGFLLVVVAANHSNLVFLSNSTPLIIINADFNFFKFQGKKMLFVVIL